MSNAESNCATTSREPRYKIGDTVKFREAKCYGSRVTAAIVLDVHGADCFSLQVFPNDTRGPYRATSVSVGNNGHYIEA